MFLVPNHIFILVNKTVAYRVSNLKFRLISLIVYLSLDLSWAIKLAILYFKGIFLTKTAPPFP